jgi:hypothetical protein
VLLRQTVPLLANPSTGQEALVPSHTSGCKFEFKGQLNQIPQDTGFQELSHAKCTVMKGIRHGVRRSASDQREIACVYGDHLAWPLVVGALLGSEENACVCAQILLVHPKGPSIVRTLGVTLLQSVALFKASCTFS